ncbi:MAG: ImmA/IrrE family metallo-endopeptidase [Bacteroidia bacterium]|nr:ImmA/IrrE family metallo-endopeptidase [Bacteroidia bacterium]
MATKVKVNREILKWARTSAKVSLDKASKTISKTCTADRIKEWESPEGKDAPTISQLKKLARLYRRPVDIFNLPYIPKEFPKLKDFRKDKDELGTGVIFMMREIQEKQDWLHNFYVKNKTNKLPFVSRFNIKHDPEVVAKDIRKTLGINIKDNSLKPLKYWIDKIESKRIFVTLSSNFHTRLKLDSDNFKGFVIADSFAPFIFLNSDDWDHGQLFTLAHELAHIWIGVSGISNETGLIGNLAGLHPVEKFCNEVALKILMPEEDLKLFIPENVEVLFKHISKAGRKLGLSNKDVSIRAAQLGLLPESKLKEYVKTSDELWKDFLYKESRKPKSSGGPNYYIMQLRRNSKAFANVIMDSYKRGRLNGSDASRLLNVREANFGKFETYIYK